MSSVAQSRDLSDRKTIENFAALVQSAERLKMLAILTVADIRAVGPGVWNGWKAQLLRTLYYETEPVLTGGFSEVNRAQRVALAQTEFRNALKHWPAERLEAYIARLYPAYWLKVDLQHKVEHAHFVRAAEDAGKTLATTIGFDSGAVTELTVLAPDHPWLLSIIAGACAMAGANIVDAQIYTTTDGLALDNHFAVARIRTRRGRGAARKPHRRFDREGATRRIAAAGNAGHARAAEGPHQGFRAGALGHHQQSVVAPLHHDGSHRARSHRAAL